MKKIYFTLLGMLFLFCLSAQIICTPVKAFAFSTIIQPGTIRVDENGAPVPMPINKQRFIYLITTCKTAPVISSVLYGKTAVKADAKAINELTFEGIKTANQKAVLINPGKNKYLWRVNIYEIYGNTIPETNAAILVKGILGVKSFSVVIKEEVALEGIPTY